MAWRIHHWDAERGAGAIESPHFGPVPFDASANVDAVDDFHPGEPVLVELDGKAPNFRVLVIRPMCQRQPENTHWPPFDSVNGRFGDARIERGSPPIVPFWVGDCCSYCTPNAIRVRFEDVAFIVGIDDDAEFDDPLFRLASPAEIQANRLVVPSDYSAFCVVTSHGRGPDGRLILIVARAAQVVQHERPS
jgi:hypothetical protein